MIMSTTQILKAAENTWSAEWKVTWLGRWEHNCVILTKILKTSVMLACKIESNLCVGAQISFSPMIEDKIGIVYFRKPGQVWWSCNVRIMIDKNPSVVNQFRLVWDSGFSLNVYVNKCYQYIMNVDRSNANKYPFADKMWIGFQRVREIIKLNLSILPRTNVIGFWEVVGVFFELFKREASGSF